MQRLAAIQEDRTDKDCSWFYRKLKGRKTMEQGMCVMAGIGVDTGEAVTALQSVKDKLGSIPGILCIR